MEKVESEASDLDQDKDPANDEGKIEKFKTVLIPEKLSEIITARGKGIAGDSERRKNYKNCKRINQIVSAHNS